MGQVPPRLLPTLLVLCACGLPMLAATAWLAVTVGVRDLTSWLAPYRSAWYALPLVMAGFVLLAPVPVLLLVAATGLVFGPILGPLYAMAGCLAAGSVAFAAGRWVGHSRLEHWGGERVMQVTGLLHRNGTLAVFLMRKVPAPFVLVNVIIGASSIPYRDFVVGTVLGLGAMVIGLAGVGHQALQVWENPTPRALARVAVPFAAALGAAVVINHAMRRPSHADDGHA